MVVYLIDAVTGRILHRVTRHGSQGPVRANNKDIVKLIIGKHNLTSPMSSYSRPDIVTKTQFYFFTHSVKTIAVTTTAKGVASKQLLISTIGDQVLALDKRFVDPRRTVNPTPAKREEGVIPLTDSIPIMHSLTLPTPLKWKDLEA